MFAPPPREKARPGDDHLPKGDCQYILLHPETKGLRCTCVGFSLNTSIPGSTCCCGHQACYHYAEKAVVSSDKDELEALQRRVTMLEEELDRERTGGRAELIERLGRLEELMDRTRAENESEMKGMYRGMSSLWHNVGLLTKRTPYYDDHIEALVDDAQRIRNRLIEVDDASIRLEERVEALENTSSMPSYGSRRRKASTPPDNRSDTPPDSTIAIEDNVVGTSRRVSTVSDIVMTNGRPRGIPEIHRAASTESDSPAWTVHVSLMPTSEQPFPFEKDTKAYHRCLSRGLHRFIVVQDTDGQSFVDAVSDAFSSILRGRPWMPLVARICDAQNLRGLPMLRQLQDHLIGSDYDATFLKENCAVLDEDGKIMALYIAMLNDTLSWDELGNLEPYMPGLEAAWEYDTFLDGPLKKDYSESGRGGGERGPVERRTAGDILPWSPSSTRLKRAASEISRTSSFGSSADGENARAKIRRQCSTATVEVVGRRAEAV
ncbi:hypothetical protein F5884DRAFT_192392 [Xylogone sp. PMI_703]|nr:hypothetical protein F5884DRAFT_192392 [Xylogone sp. PMI_703]